MDINLKKYKTIVFDCDGVILNSNFIKTEAYFITAKNFGATNSQAKALVEYHMRLGGISRYHKFDWYVREVLQQKSSPRLIKNLLSSFSYELKSNLMTCDIAEGLSELRAATENSKWMIVSGGDQEEIRELFTKRNLIHFFDGGVYGSPENKDSLLAKEKTKGNLIFDALFIGDSIYDYKAAKKAGLDFLFLTNWTDLIGWQKFCKDNKILYFDNIKKLLSYI